MMYLLLAEIVAGTALFTMSEAFMTQENRVTVFYRKNFMSLACVRPR